VPSDTPQPNRQLPSNALSLVLVLVALGFGIWLMVAIWESVASTVSDGYERISIRHDMKPDEYHDVDGPGFILLLTNDELSVIYGIFGAALLFVYGLLIAEKLIVVASVTSRLAFGLIAVILLIVPYIALNIHVDATYMTVSGRLHTAECGTWMHPTPVASRISECIDALDGKSRAAVTIAVAGLAAPFMLILSLELRRKMKGTEADPMVP
jgi:hypothetical protein